MVLLRNDGGLLPFANTTALAFIGPHANATTAMQSNYAGQSQLVLSHSPLQAAAAMGLDVTYARGCNICDVVPPGFPNMPCTRESLSPRVAVHFPPALPLDLSRRPHAVL